MQYFKRIRQSLQNLRALRDSASCAVSNELDWVNDLFLTIQRTTLSLDLNNWCFLYGEGDTYFVSSSYITLFDAQYSPNTSSAELSVSLASI